MAVDFTFDDTWTQPGNNAIDGRYHDGAFLAPAGANATVLDGYRDGVLPSAYSGGQYLDLMVVPDSPTPGMAVRTYAGQCVIGRASQGQFLSTLRTFSRVDLAASSTTNPRRDLIYAQVLDTGLGDGETRTKIGRVTGAPAGSPALPALPAGAIPLADVAVAANATQITSANITDLRKAAGLKGAVRLMLAGDSHSDPGIYPGDARWCRTHLQIETWGTDGLWHGSLTKVLETTTVDTTVRTVTAAVMTQVIADPGHPYYIEVSGAVMFDIGAGVTVELGATLNGIATRIGGRQIHSSAVYTNSGGSSILGAVVRMMPVTHATVLTGANTVNLTLFKSGTPGNGYNGVASADFSMLTIKRIPA